MRKYDWCDAQVAGYSRCERCAARTPDIRALAFPREALHSAHANPSQGTELPLMSCPPILPCSRLGHMRVLTRGQYKVPAKQWMSGRRKHCLGRETSRSCCVPQLHESIERAAALNAHGNSHLGHLADGVLCDMCVICTGLSPFPFAFRVHRILF